MLGAEVPQEKMDLALKELNGSLKLLEEKFIQDKPFIVGDNMTLADLVAIVEVIQVSTLLKPICGGSEYRIFRSISCYFFHAL